MQFLVSKREQIYDEMVIHVNKSSLSYQQICEHYINASDVTLIANRTGDFIITGARLFLKRPILIVKPTYVEKPGRKMDTKIHEFKYMTEDLNLDPSKCLIFMVYNGYNYYAPCLPPMIKEMYYKKVHKEAHLPQVINRFQDIQQLLPMSDARATMDHALLHIHATSSLLNATEVTSGARNVTAGKEVPVPPPHSGTHKRTCQNNPKLPTQNSETNGENVQHENAGGKNDTQSSEHNAQRKESETNRNNFNSEDKEDGSEEEGNTDTNDGHRSDNKIYPPKTSTTRKPNQCWCGLVYDSNQDVEDHIKLDHANNSYICSECKLPLGTQQSLWSHFRKQHLGIYQYTCQELKKDGSGVKCSINRDELSEIRFHLETEHGKGRTDVRCQFCDMPLSQQRWVKEHEAICKKGELAHKEKRFICQFCHKGFPGTGNFRNHQMVVHWKELGRKQAKRHHCDKCGLDYTNPSSLKNHVCKPENTVTATGTLEKVMVITNHRRREGRGRIRRARREISRKNPRLQKRLLLMIAIASKSINFLCQENVLLWTYIYIHFARNIFRDYIQESISL